MRIFDFLGLKRAKGGYRKTVFLSGTGRSGTTWLSQLINASNDYRILFEPFHNSYVPEWSGFRFRQYLRGDEKEPELLRATDSILSGRVSNTWIDKRLLPAAKKKLLIKDIRTNLMLRWLKNRYRKMPIILLIRHPGAVAQSKIKLGWGSHLVEFTDQPRLMEDFLHPFRDLLLEPPESIFQSHVLFWCIENYVPLLQFRKDEILVLFYEQLVLDPETQLRKVFKHIREPWNPEVLSKVSKPSFMAKEHSAIKHHGADMISGWRDGIPQSDLDRMAETLSRFGFDKLYAPSDIPDVEALKHIARF